MEENKNLGSVPEQNDAFTGQSATKESANPENIVSRWYEIEEEYRQQYYDLTDDDVKIDDYGFGKTIERIAIRRGKNPDEIQTEIENW